MEMKSDGEDVHLSALVISPLRMVRNVWKGWQEEKCRKHLGFVSLTWRQTSSFPFALNLSPFEIFRSRNVISSLEASIMNLMLCI